jgi:hypothetical protein
MTGMLAKGWERKLRDALYYESDEVIERAVSAVAGLVCTPTPAELYDIPDGLLAQPPTRPPTDTAWMDRVAQQAAAGLPDNDE